MHAQTRHDRGRRRRGIVLVLILAMLGLMAVIGVTFATFSGQAQIGSRNFALSKATPEPDQFFDFALSQLINDTENPLSAIYGHSLLRDMYGNDARNNGVLPFIPTDVDYRLLPNHQNLGRTRRLWIQQAQLTAAGLVVQTNIPTSGSESLVNLNFLRWTLRLDPQRGPGNTVFPAQTFEVLIDDNTGPFHVLTLTPPDTSVAVAQPSVGATFTLDGRFLRAFNGTGMYPQLAAERGNFMFARFTTGDPTTSPLNPDDVAMDEDYDAADLDNWFLSLQSADGNVVIPSFHRPGVIATYGVDANNNPITDWSIRYDPLVPPTHPNNLPYFMARSKILRPRAVDHPKAGQATFPDLLPGPDGKVAFDVDNDGDGVKDSVWLDLGHPLMRTPEGKLYKPLFAFSVVGLNGRIPINTAGNLNRRDPTTGAWGMPNPDHTSHLGYSPSEVNPKFAFSSQQTGDGIAQLQKLLQGDPTQTPVVAGRWGEAGLLTNAANTGIWPRAGRSTGNGGSNDLFNTLDVWRGTATNEEEADLLDNAGGLMLPVERFRRFVTPVDPTGNGRIIAWFARDVDSIINGRYGHGFDRRGRSGYYMYFRPPGVPAGTPATNIAGGTTNVYHGFDSARNPLDGDFNGPVTREYWAAMPWNQPANVAQGQLPTFQGDINAEIPSATANYGLYPGYQNTNNGAGSLARDLPDELNLYNPGRYDEPFGPVDLEWLYRAHDVDGSSLSSRLKDLLPELLDENQNPGGRAEALRRRRLLTIESWDTNTYAWANDNPAGAFANNARFSGVIDVSINPPRRIANPSWPALDDVTQLNPAPIGPGNTLLTPATVAAPSFLTRGRRINLNVPLPVSTDPREPTRLKWISETYQALKWVLPPKAVDHPEELAQLGQFVTNIIDFRDTDDTVTIWVNPDVELSPATAQAAPRAILKTATSGGTPLIHYGMEYQPVAINEVLAYCFKRRGANDTPIDTGRFFLELINTLTKAKADEAGVTPAKNPSDLTLRGWDIVITREDPQSAGLARPDPVTGQLPANVASSQWYKSVPLSDGTSMRDANDQPVTIKALDEDGSPDHFVLGYDVTQIGGREIEQDESGNRHMPTPDAILRDPNGTAPGAVEDILPVPATTPQTTPPNGEFYWVYLRRPADPNAPTDPARPGYLQTDMVVVDSMRFSYVNSDVTVTNNRPSPQPPVQQIWSYQRFQPYRGGQGVPNGGTSATYEPATAYGYSEQVHFRDQAGQGDADIYGVWDTTTPPQPDGNPPSNMMTAEIRHSIKAANSNAEEWAPVVIHDRDFTSVAELLLVPGAPPGLFTKQFVEDADGVIPPAPLDQVPEQRPSGDGRVGRRLGERPHVFPYLPDQFYYTAANDATEQSGGPNATGWYRILEFFEVPSPVLGAIGPVADGENRDWMRQDLRPGQINLNLIIDEEVFFGLIDDPRLNRAVPADPNLIPRVVTMVDATNGNVPIASYPLTNRGYYDVALGTDQLKASFVDFLRLRHANLSGGAAVISGFMFGSQPEAPFHSLSYPDIRYTIMRPAVPDNDGLRPTALNSPPMIPPRRLFQIPDYSLNLGDQNNLRSNPAGYASALATPPIDWSQVLPNGGPYSATLADSYANLANLSVLNFQTPQGPLYLYGGESNPAIPGDPNADPPVPDTPALEDRREHPLFRTEWLQKLTNNATVRTHQYAVWVTVGFFEVVKPGNPQVALTNPLLAQDELGPELGSSTGKVVRHRMFAIVDRSRAGGFNAQNPSDFRPLVIYRKPIE